ncbi:MAG: hypothetical protein COA79_05185 [Planctomycetota bacterium]|nr:MAG: hypothetical protein COA79_05185 [Planctomycetota bacterium]
MIKIISLALLLILFSFTITYAQGLDFGDEDDDQATKAENEEKVLELVKKFIESKTTGPTASVLMVGDKSTISKKILKKLEPPVTIEWDEVTLNEAVEDMREFLGINIIIHKEVPKEDLISIKVKEMKGKNLVKWFLRMNDLKGSIQNGVLFIMPKAIAPKVDLKMVIYEIGDITTPIKNFKGPDMSLEGATGLK